MQSKVIRVRWPGLAHGVFFWGFFLLLIGFLAVSVSICTVGWVRQALARSEIRADRLHYYYALVQAFIATMLVTVLADNLGILWIAMEGTTITSAVLVGFHGDKLGLDRRRDS